MPALDLHVDGAGAWPDLAAKGWTEATAIAIAGLAGGMASGLPSVTIRFDLPDGSPAIGQTSLRRFLLAADALRARYGDPPTAP